MTAWVISAVVSLGFVVLAGWAMPAWAMRRLLPTLEGSSQLVTNYRGRRIPTGLGLVWLVWAAAVAAVGALVTVALYVAQASGSVTLVGGAPVRIVGAVPLALVVGAFAFGFIDDVYGTGESKGFGGHLRALREGRLTTGGLKVLGIGVLALLAATGVDALSGPLSVPGPGLGARVVLALAGWACAALVIALSANFVNLTDLRPGRALKSYGLMVSMGVVITLVVLLADGSSGDGTLGSVLMRSATSVSVVLCLAILVLGPVFAVWRSDLGERATLGDAGANAMGALAGYLLVWRSPLWLVAVFAVILLALNLASERWSFSDVIEKVALLRWIDGLGRLPAEPDVVISGQNGNGSRAGGPAAEDGDARRDGGADSDG